jgi:hypothetical protein
MATEIRLEPNFWNRFKDDLKKIKSSLSSQEISIHRAKKLKEFVIENVSSGQAGLHPLSSATTFLTGQHNPMSLTGKLLQEIKYKPDGKNDALVGYLPDSKKVEGKNITYTKLAEIHHTGYRIPLTGPKGKKVIGWMKRVGLISGKGEGLGKGGSKQWLIVPPRPFFIDSVYKYVMSGLDNEAAEKYIREVLKK